MKVTINVFKLIYAALISKKMDYKVNGVSKRFEVEDDNKQLTEIACTTQGPLRRSLFGGVPPFINYVPAGGFTGGLEKGPQYWDENKVMTC